MDSKLNDKALDILFRDARSFSHWLDKDVSDQQLEEIYELMKMGPTAANSCPIRIIFVKSQEAKKQLKEHLDQGNIEKSMSAPVVAIFAMDLEFYEKLPLLFPHTDARSWYAGKPEKISKVAERNSMLQGAYFILAARSMGLDTGPMSGFNNISLDQEFFSDGKLKSLFICALGYGNKEKLYPRGPRLSFNEVCTVK